MPNLVILVLQIAVVIAASRAVAVLFQRMRQPKVIGEMFAGIMLGPSLLGWLAPHFSASLFIPSSLGYLGALSQVGVVIYMFLVGLAPNHKTLLEHGHTAVLTSHTSASWLRLYWARDLLTFFIRDSPTTASPSPDSPSSWARP